jgi:hypothetical protein
MDPDKLSKRKPQETTNVSEIIQVKALIEQTALQRPTS